MELHKWVGGTINRWHSIRRLAVLTGGLAVLHKWVGGSTWVGRLHHNLAGGICIVHADELFYKWASGTLQVGKCSTSGSVVLYKWARGAI